MKVTGISGKLLTICESELTFFLFFFKNRDTWNQPARVVGLGHVRARAVSASGVVSAAIDDDGSLWVWGRSKRGQLGLGKGVIGAIKPAKVEALSDHQIIKVPYLTFYY